MLEYNWGRKHLDEGGPNGRKWETEEVDDVGKLAFFFSFFFYMNATNSLFISVRATLEKEELRRKPFLKPDSYF